jgi:hypothetical protein
VNRSRGKYDVILDSGDLLMGFALGREPGRPATVTSELTPGRIDEVVRHADVPRVIDNLDAGMGFSRRIEQVPNGYAYTLPGHTRAPGGIFCPAGKVTEIPLPASWDRAPIIESTFFHGDTYLITQGRHQLVLPSGVGPAVVSVDGGAGFFGAGQAIFNDRLYVGGYNHLIYKPASGAWSARVAVPRRKLRSVNWRPLGVPTQVLVATLPGSLISWCPITRRQLVSPSSRRVEPELRHLRAGRRSPSRLHAAG